MHKLPVTVGLPGPPLAFQHAGETLYWIPSKNIPSTSHASMPEKYSQLSNSSVLICSRLLLWCLQYLSACIQQYAYLQWLVKMARVVYQGASFPLCNSKRGSRCLKLPCSSYRPRHCFADWKEYLHNKLFPVAPSNKWPATCAVAARP